MEHIHVHFKKHLYWDKYGVKTFPYRGKRKYFPCIYQDYDGTIMIRNDVFGLTIAQFEREFKALLARRKENEPLIQNVRFPIKSTKEYIEYLKCGDDTVQGCSRAGVLTDDDCQVCKLVHVAGTEYDMRMRQRMFILVDNISRKSYWKLSQLITSGSLAEGIDLPGSDIDKMIVIPATNVIDDIKHLNLSTRNTTLLMENDIRYPGFCKLKFVAEGYDQDITVTNSLMETEDGLYLSTQGFMQTLFKVRKFESVCIHGPCITNIEQDVDQAFCFKSIFWPTVALNWCNRHRKGQWPSYTVIDTVLKDGCLLVAIGPRNSEDELLWRISFSMAEKRLTHSMNYTQLLCYVLLKLTLKHTINKNEEVKDMLCSYFLKTTVFWLSEDISINIFKMSNLSQCYLLCLEKLISFVRNCYCPNYFIPQHNMFCGKIDEWNSKPLLNILEELQNTQFPLIMDRIVDSDTINVLVTSNFIRKNALSVDVELLFYRVSLGYFLCLDGKGAFTFLQYIGLLMKSESSEFLLGALRYYHALIKQRVCQLFILPDCRHARYNTIRHFHKYLMDGTKTDAVSGWLLYASFYYVLGQYNTTLQIVDKVLSRCTPDMLLLSKVSYTTEEKNTYQHKTKNHLTLNQKMRQTTFCCFDYKEQSTLIPQELQLEVQDCVLWVSPVVMSQCLQFLCYHHLGDVNNKQRALRELYLTIKEGYFVPTSFLSDSLVILGVCHEVSGNKDTAYHCYNDALHCEEYVCKSAKQRLANLLRT